MAKGRRIITQELCDRLLEGFRRCGVNFRQVGAFVGCDPRLARRAYLFGFQESVTGKRPPLRPIRTILEAEQKAAAAAAVAVAPPVVEVLSPEEERAAQVAELQTGALTAMVEEARLLGVLRNSTLGIASMASQLLAGMQPVIVRVRESLQRLAVLDNPGSAEAIRQLAKLNEVVGGSVDATKKLVEAERLLMGSPTEIIKLQTAAPAPAPAEESHDTAQLLVVLGQLAAARAPKAEQPPAEEEGGAYLGDDGGEPDGGEPCDAPAA